MICLTPGWTSHRADVSVVDSPPLSNLVSEGVKASGYRWAAFRIRVAIGNPTNVAARPLFWDEIGEQWIPDNGISEQEFKLNDGNRPPGETIFEARGRDFYIAVTGIDGLGDKAVNVDVAAHGLENIGSMRLPLPSIIVFGSQPAGYPYRLYRRGAPHQPQ